MDDHKREPRLRAVALYDPDSRAGELAEFSKALAMRQDITPYLTSQRGRPALVDYLHQDRAGIELLNKNPGIKIKVKEYLDDLARMSALGLAQTEGDFLQRHAGSVTVAGGGLARMGIGLWVGAQRAASGDPLGGVAHIALTAAAGALTGTGLAAMVATARSIFRALRARVERALAPRSVPSGCGFSSKPPRWRARPPCRWSIKP